MSLSVILDLFIVNWLNVNRIDASLSVKILRWTESRHSFQPTHVCIFQPGSNFCAIIKPRGEKGGQKVDAFSSSESQRNVNRGSGFAELIVLVFSMSIPGALLIAPGWQHAYVECPPIITAVFYSQGPEFLSISYHHHLMKRNFRSSFADPVTFIDGSGFSYSDLTRVKRLFRVKDGCGYITGYVCRGTCLLPSGECLWLEEIDGN